MSTSPPIAVAMSGGVDSSVAAALLVERGERVFGIMMRLWSAGSEELNRCCSPEDMAAARQVAADLRIPFYVLDMRERFKRVVVDFFIDGYAHGITPNPCLECNRIIRWQELLSHAIGLGATHLATGHYARVVTDDRGVHRLYRAADVRKDQSYVLSLLGQGQLGRAMFPLGGYAKDAVRDHARRLGLQVAERPESQDLCFVGPAGYRSFLRTHGDLVDSPGPILDHHGAQLGRHQGLHGFTIGQRRGLGLAAQGPLYVLAKDPANNALTVGPRQSQGRQTFSVERTNWIRGVPPDPDARLQVQVRYKAAPSPCAIAEHGAKTEVHLEQALPDVTPGQAAVFYQEEECLGGGIIAR